MKLRSITWFGLGCLLLASPAAAQRAAPEQTEPELAPRPRLYRSTISVGTGVLGYLDGGAPGASMAWDARYAFAASRMFSLEAGYLGGVGSNGLGGVTIPTMLEGDLLVKPFRGERFNPFALGGAGWGNFHGTEGPGDTSTVLVPLGIGAEYRFTDRLVADGRFTYRLVTSDAVGPTRADLDNWTAMARLGALF